MYKYTSRRTEQVKRVKTTLVGIRHVDGLLDVASYGDNAHNRGVVKAVPRFAVEKAAFLHEGSIVWANYNGRNEWFSATITWMGPDGFTDIHYTDGDFEEGVLPEHFTPRYDLVI